MRSKLNGVFAFAAAAAITLGSFGTVQAAVVDVSGVSGTWTALEPPQGPTNVTGIGTNSVSWGTPQRRQQSGYSFVGAAAGQIETGVDFNLGTFNHNNFVINIGTSITGAGLGVAVNLLIGGVERVVSAGFNFAHLETNNAGEGSGRRGSGGSCANGGANGSGVNVSGCADRVTILDNKSSDQSFVLDGFQYILEITGFIRDGIAFSEFWTEENKANSAILRARFTLVGPTAGEPNPGGGGGGGDPIPSPVPLPAAGWMILAALGVLAATRARRKA